MAAGDKTEEEPSTKTASVKFDVSELMTLAQVLRTYELRGPVEQLAMVIPKFEALKKKVTTALNALQGVTVEE